MMEDMAVHVAISSHDGLPGETGQAMTYRLARMALATGAAVAGILVTTVAEPIVADWGTCATTGVHHPFLEAMVGTAAALSVLVSMDRSSSTSSGKGRILGSGLVGLASASLAMVVTVCMGMTVLGTLVAGMVTGILAGILCLCRTRSWGRAACHRGTDAG